MSNVLDTDSDNAQSTQTKFDGEAMPSVTIFCQPVVAAVSENPFYLKLQYNVTLPGVACGPNYFRLEKTLTLCKYFCLDKTKGQIFVGKYMKVVS